MDTPASVKIKLIYQKQGHLYLHLKAVTINVVNFSQKLFHWLTTNKYCNILTVNSWVSCTHINILIQSYITQRKIIKLLTAGWRINKIRHSLAATRVVFDNMKNEIVTIMWRTYWLSDPRQDLLELLSSTKNNLQVFIIFGAYTTLFIVKEKTKYRNCIIHYVIWW